MNKLRDRKMSQLEKLRNKKDCTIQVNVQYKWINTRSQSVYIMVNDNLCNNLFFKRYLKNIINTSIEIKADRTIYIHLIAREAHLPYVTAIKDVIVEMSSK